MMYTIYVKQEVNISSSYTILVRSGTLTSMITVLEVPVVPIRITVLVDTAKITVLDEVLLTSSKCRTLKHKYSEVFALLCKFDRI